MRKQKMNVFVVIPAYNESKVIDSVVRKVRKEVENVIVVDDGSTDQTGKISERSGATVITHIVNRGQGAALQTGISFALKNGADIVVTFDADGQFEAKEIGKIIKPLLDEEVQVVLGSRFLPGAASRTNISFSKRVVLTTAAWFTRLYTGLSVSDTHNGFRAFNKIAASLLDIKHDGMAHASEIIEQIKKHKFTFKEVPVTVYYTPYSLQKGQKLRNSFKIVWNLLFRRISR